MRKISKFKVIMTVSPQRRGMRCPVSIRQILTAFLISGVQILPSQKLLMLLIRTKLCTTLLEDLWPSGPVFLRRCRHRFDGQQVEVIERRRGGGNHARLNLHVVLPDGSRMWIPAGWTSLEAPDADAPKLLGALPDFVKLRTLLDDLERRLEAEDGRGSATGAAGASGVGGTDGCMARDSVPGPGGAGRGAGGADGPEGGSGGKV